ncbi:MAG: cytochrome c oxidase subunit II [Gammaproteobacteria bacterium]|jgi:cytochrome c oxidase subunit II|nr:cytochrome c oxidase subunit II [Gammaproteobacteria bacterium]MBT4462534.1 cytochrome c oxidase subunit II [Gammaproteobacteria bacterium]MBT4654781.1 cytochrome c oxidase subunit II [Gammaproteobacteria bacterium]MBT5116834.1 cytochrome c oxidase subunit II [Gammaproteobacteria bacterium]MBT5761654.1 cytochrome c oxidase subunit II [Gammaproteobacteria bacterium]
MRISNILLMVIFPTTALAEWETNMPRGVTPTSEVAYDLHMLIFYITVVIGILVFSAMLYSIIYHRKSLGHEPAKFHESTKVEIIWTVIPFIILVGMAIPATKALIMMEDTRDSEITVKVTGYQWMWQYEYLEDDVSFFSKIDNESNVARRLGSNVDVKKVKNYLRNVDNAVVLPTNTKVRILLTANDVIHAWWVPELGGKKDAIPGFVNELWVDIKEPGTYRGQCAELCGKDHGFMPIVVHAVSKPEYYKWVGIQKTNKVAKNK